MDDEPIPETGAPKPRAWSLKAGLALGLLVGVLLWWNAYQDGGGYLQNLRFLVGAPALGAALVMVGNWVRKAGPFDPEVIERNRQGRV